MKIGIIGSGNVARKIAALCARAGHQVRLSQRQGSEGASQEEMAPGTFAQAAEHGEVVILAIPYSACESVLPTIRGPLGDKIVIDASNPLGPDWSPLPLGPDNSAGEAIARLLPESRVVKAFNTVFADSMTVAGLQRGAMRAAGFLCGDVAEANARVAELLDSLGFAPIDAGPMLAARYLEAMAHLNIQLAVGMGGGTNAVFLYDRGRA